MTVTPSPTTGRSPQPTPSRPPLRSVGPLLPTESARLTGTLGFDSIEGGCAYLETAEGKRYQVIYPSGWRIEGATGRLIGPGGTDLRPGSVVSVRGSIVTDMASTCQVGPMFRATEVLSTGG